MWQRICVFLTLLLIMSFIAWPQEQLVNTDERLSFVGMRLAELIEYLGPPEMVYTARGIEVWQDDVVFHYTEGDFYIFKDRVWQVKLTAAFGLSLKDSKAAALLLLGKEVLDMGDYLLLPLPSGDWPLMLRVNFNNAGLISAIYIYRPDF
jgi:lipopolysaccharide export system protein LptC